MLRLECRCRSLFAELPNCQAASQTSQHPDTHLSILHSSAPEAVLDQRSSFSSTASLGLQKAFISKKARHRLRGSTCKGEVHRDGVASDQVLQPAQVVAARSCDAKVPKSSVSPPPVLADENSERCFGGPRSKKSLQEKALWLVGVQGLN